MAFGNFMVRRNLREMERTIVSSCWPIAQPAKRPINGIRQKTLLDYSLKTLF